ncbi:MAG: hypothetical protein R2690_03485 [Acidimicrobiales bacterium]
MLAGDAFGIEVVGDDGTPGGVAGHASGRLGVERVAVVQAGGLVDPAGLDVGLVEVHDRLVRRRHEPIGPPAGDVREVAGEHVGQRLGPAQQARLVWAGAIDGLGLGP